MRLIKSPKIDVFVKKIINRPVAESFEFISNGDGKAALIHLVKRCVVTFYEVIIISEYQSLLFS